jgi:hypothetical protein
MPLKGSKAADEALRKVKKAIKKTKLPKPKKFSEVKIVDRTND